jgi:hypothetical protein
MARCCLSVGPGNKKGHLVLRLVVCVVLFGFVKFRRESLRFFSASCRDLWGEEFCGCYGLDSLW